MWTLMVDLRVKNMHDILRTWVTNLSWRVLFPAIKRISERQITPFLHPKMMTRKVVTKWLSVLLYSKVSCKEVLGWLSFPHNCAKARYMQSNKERDLGCFIVLPSFLLSTKFGTKNLSHKSVFLNMISCNLGSLEFSHLSQIHGGSEFRFGPVRLLSVGAAPLQKFLSGMWAIYSLL